MIKILVIEDDIKSCQYCSSCIDKIKAKHGRFTNITVYYAKDYNEAWDNLTTKIIDIILLDIDLPGKNGFELTEEIRSTPPYKMIPVVFISGTQQSQLDIFKKYHNYDYITKPYTLELFMNVMLPLLDAVATEKLNEFNRQEGERLITIVGPKIKGKVRVDNILFAETKGRKLTVYTKHKTYSHTAMKLDDFIKKVSSPHFIRSHRCFAVNVHNVSSVTEVSSRLWDLHFDNLNVTCELSVNNRKEFMSIFDKR